MTRAPHIVEPAIQTLNIGLKYMIFLLPGASFPFSHLSSHHPMNPQYYNWVCALKLTYCPIEIYGKGVLGEAKMYPGCNARA